MENVNVYAFDFNTGRYETHASDYLDTSTRIAFECSRTWRKKVGTIVYFRDWQDAKALKEHVEINRFVSPTAHLNAWGNPIPKTTYKQIISDSVTANWLDWIAQRDMGGY